MHLIFWLWVVMMARWAWPGCVASSRCRGLGCPECTWFVPCNGALRQLCTALPRARSGKYSLDKSSCDA